MKKKLFVVDTDEDFQNQVKSLCPPDQVEISFYSTSMEIFSLIGKEKPLLILLNLEVPDVSDFVMFDLLKKTDNISIPVIITYSNQSEKDLQQYKKLKFQAKGYYPKPIDKEELYGLLENYLDLEEEDDDDFSDENIDRLVRGELLDENTEAKEHIFAEPAESPEDTKERMAIEIEAETDDDDMGADIFIEEPAEKDTVPLDNGLQDQIISLQRENEYLRSEAKVLSNSLESQKADLEKKNEEIRQLKSEVNEKTMHRESEAGQLKQLEKQMTLLRENYHQLEAESQESKDSLLQKIETLKDYAEKLENQNSEVIKKLKAEEKEKSEIQRQVNDLNNQITDKEREMVARNHEFEKRLQEKSEELVQEAEERLVTEFKKKEQQFQYELEQLREEKEGTQAKLHRELEKTTTLYKGLQDENKELKKREDSLNRTISNLAEEKVTLSEKVMTLDELTARQKKELEEKEREHRIVVESHKQQIEEVRNSLNYYRNQVKELGSILQTALSVIQKENSS